AQPATIDDAQKDYLRIPSTNTTADTILTWPIFARQYPPEYLIDAILGKRDDDKSDAFVVRHGEFESLSDERIPSLIDRFLRNVHTKNPILDVDALLLYGQAAAATGPGWDAASCLVLLASLHGSEVLSATGAPLHDLDKDANEERSWYYYLTEVALRRISNRILSTFYRQDHTTWHNILPLIPIAKEFETQILGTKLGDGQQTARDALLALPTLPLPRHPRHPLRSPTPARKPGSAIPRRRRHGLPPRDRTKAQLPAPPPRDLVRYPRDCFSGV
ncbi:hypothetical protein V497_08410, partial [Pseudogymnoascus sp. VKM F-4516 (FW-969)]